MICGWKAEGGWNYTRLANSEDNFLDIVRSPKRARLFKSNWEHMYPIMKSQELARAAQALINYAKIACSAVVFIIDLFVCRQAFNS